MLRTKITIITILTVIHLSGFSSSAYGVSSYSPWWTHFSYPFFHGSIVHLICNLYAIWFCLNERTYPKQILIPILYAITIVSSFIYTSGEPTIGISGAIFAMIGINIIQIPTRTNVIYIVSILAAGFIMPQIAGVNHLISFLLGGMIALFTRNIKQFNHDYRRTH